MGTIITSSAVTKADTSNGIISSVDLAVDAAEKCIAGAGIGKEEIGILINIGVFRDLNIAEPSMASLIQQKLGMNLDFTSFARGSRSRRTFSLDMMKGGCGFLYAVRVIDALLKTGEAKHAMIVSSDAHPSQSLVAGFPYTSIGTATILSPTDSDRGFRSIQFETSGNGRTGCVAYLDVKEMGTEMKRNVAVKFDDSYAEHAHRFALESMKRYLRKERIDPAKIRVMIGSQHQGGFSRKLLDSIGVNGYTHAVDLNGQFGDTFTSSMSLGYHDVVEKRILGENDQVLFLAIGSGLTSACGLYIA